MASDDHVLYDFEASSAPFSLCKAILDFYIVDALFVPVTGSV